ncbi:MAG TPA: tetratricopeptide repeat protein [Bryobacteraceae bacterium]
MPQDTSGRLDSWKEIAAFLKRGTRTVQRWEREEQLPVHRLQHGKQGSIYAYKSELEAWWESRGAKLQNEAPAEPAVSPSVAVLPFADLSQGKDQAYFCDGMAEEIISALSRIHGLRVASRTSSFQFRDTALDSREIGNRLHVAALLEGSVRKVGGRLRITVQLTDAANGFQRWSERYEREMSDVFAIQEEIAQNIIRALEITLSQREQTALERPGTTDVRAYEYYWRARHYYYQYSPRHMEFALQLFCRALEMDPNYARAWAGLADCWSFLYVHSNRSEDLRLMADEASRKAVEMDPQSAQAQASRGLSLSLEGKNDEAAQAFEAAVRLDPGLFEAHYFYARHEFALGRLETAIEHYEAAMRARPEDFQSPLLCAQIYDDLGRPADATRIRKSGIKAAERHLTMNPDDARALYMAANGMVATGERDRGRQFAERALAVRPDDPMLLYNVGCIYSMLGMADAALDCLEKASEKGLTQKGWYEHDSNLDPVRKLPRFQALMRALE